MAKRKMAAGTKTVAQKRVTVKKGAEVKAAMADNATAKPPTKFARWYEPFLEEEPEPDNRVIKLDIERIAASDLSDDEAGAVLFAELNKQTAKYQNVEFNTTLTSYSICVAVIQISRVKTALVKSEREIGKWTFFNNLSVKTCDAFLFFFNALDYFAGLRPIEFNKTPASKLAERGGVFDLWDQAEKEPRSLTNDFKSGKIIKNLLPLVTEALESLLYMIYGKGQEDCYYDVCNLESQMDQLAEAPDDEKLHAELQATCKYISLSFQTLQTNMLLRDHELYDQHPDWPVEGYEDEPSGPFDCRETRRNYSAAAHEYYKQHGNPYYLYKTTIEYFDHPMPDEPLPFFNTRQVEYSDQIRDLLAKPVFFNFDDPIARIINQDPDFISSATLNDNVEEAKFMFCMKLCFYFDKRAEALPPDSTARKLWTRAYAELYSNARNNNDRFPIGKRSADVIVNLATAAAKEEWVEKRISKDKTSENPLTYLKSIADNTSLFATQSDLISSHNKGKTTQNRRKKHKLTDKDEMFNAAMLWLERHPDKNAPQAANYVYDVRDSQNKWPDGYPRPVTAKEKNNDGFRRRIDIALAKQRKDKTTESGKQENS